MVFFLSASGRMSAFRLDMMDTDKTGIEIRLVKQKTNSDWPSVDAL